MTFNNIILCASALFIQCIAGQYCGSPVISVPVASCGCGSVAVSNNGGAFTVQSAGPIVPAGIAAAAELGLAADLAVSGTLPWLSAVEFGGQLPTAGAGSASYGCGDGNIAITQELGSSGSAASYGLNSINSLGLGLNSLGLGLNSLGLSGCGCGCR